MAYKIFTDTAANMPERLAEKYGIGVVALSYFIDGKEHTCMDCEAFDSDGFYRMLGEGVRSTTSLVSEGRYTEAFEPVLKEGRDIIYVALSSGVSGTCAVARMAAESLMEKYPGRKVFVVDSRGASMGEGMQAIECVLRMRRGMDIEANYEEALKYPGQVRQVFTVNDLMFLRRTGRLHGFSAVVGTMLNIKPILIGDPDGHIVVETKIRGRKQAVKHLADDLTTKIGPRHDNISIAEAACKEDAELLRSLIKEALPDAEVLVVGYEPVTGSHVGPGALALFYQK